MSNAVLGTKILNLLGDDRADLRAQAAAVIGAAGVVSPAIQRALVGCLKDPHQGVRRAALSSLSSLGCKGLSSELLEIMHAGDEDLAALAAAMMAQEDGKSDAALRKELSVGNVASRRQVAALLLARANATNAAALIDQLGDPAIGDSLLSRLRSELETADAKSRAVYQKAAEAVATKLARGPAGKVPKANPKRGEKAAASTKANLPEVASEESLRLAAVIRLIGYIANRSSLRSVVSYADGSRPVAVRLAALEAVRRIIGSSDAKGTDAAIGALIDHARDADAAVARAAVDALRGARIPPALQKRFAALGRAGNTDARKLAMERLPAKGGAEVVKTLIANLLGSDASAREAAAQALGKTPDAVVPLVRALVDAADEAQARRLMAALRAHREHTPASAIEVLVKAVRERNNKKQTPSSDRGGYPIERVWYEALAELAPTVHVELLFERALKLRKAGQYKDAFASLRPLLHARVDLDADQRFALAVHGLKASGRQLMANAKKGDPILGQFTDLAVRGYAVTKALAKQKDLAPEDLYVLGFSLLESGEDDDKELGADVLGAIIAEAPRTKLAKQCKNKLKLSHMI